MNMAKIKITFAGGAQSPTGSNFLLEIGDSKFLVDCGLYQGSKMASDNNRDLFTYDPSTVTALFVTHSHLDHVGRIPFIVKEGFKGQIFSVDATRELAEYVMMDSLHVLSKESEHAGLPPMYELHHVEESIKLWSGKNYHEKLTFVTSVGTLGVRFLDAGHILGSAMIEFTLNGKTLIFSGDLGNTPSPLMKDTESIHGADYLVIESVYGDRDHEDNVQKEDRLREIIKATVRNRGTLMVPAFSIERTQELLYYINDMIEHNQIERIPIFLDSPLAINVTQVYKRYTHYLNTGVQSIVKSGDDIFNFPGLSMTADKEESKAINGVPGPKVVIAGSGMMNGGRILYHAKNYLGEAKNTLLMVGYQAVGTLGRKLLEGAKEVYIKGENIKIAADIQVIHGMSAHKDSTHLQEFAAGARETLKQVFVVLGEPKSCIFLAQRLKDHYGINTTIPEPGQSFELEM